MPASARVSVMMPTYNYARFLDEAIQSVLNQTYKDFELVIVDNHSTDSTPEVVGKYLSDPRVSYHRNETNLGVVGNWNRCLELANNEYIKFICADDKFHPQILEKYIPIMDANPNISLITCDKQLFEDSNEHVKLPFEGLQPGKKMLFHTLSRYCWIGEPTSVMFRKRDLHVGKFRPDFSFHVDWDFWIRLLAIGDCYIVPEVLSYVRFHNAQITKQILSKKVISCFEEYSMCKNVQTGTGYKIDTADTNIDNIVKKRARYCAKQGLYKMIPRLHKKEYRKVFNRAFGITLREGVFTSALAEMLSRKKKSYA